MGRILAHTGGLSDDRIGGGGRGEQCDTVSYGRCGCHVGELGHPLRDHDSGSRGYLVAVRSVWCLCSSAVGNNLEMDIVRVLGYLFPITRSVPTV